MSKHQDATPPTNAPGQGSTKRNLISLTAASTAQVVIQFLIQSFWLINSGQGRYRCPDIRFGCPVPSWLRSSVVRSAMCWYPTWLLAFKIRVKKERAGIWPVSSAWPLRSWACCHAGSDLWGSEYC